MIYLERTNAIVSWTSLPRGERVNFDDSMGKPLCIQYQARLDTLFHLNSHLTSMATLDFILRCCEYSLSRHEFAFSCAFSGETLPLTSDENRYGASARKTTAHRSLV